MKQPKTLLIFPPFWEPTQPYLSLPALSSFLRNHDYEVHQWDLNILFHDTVIASDYLTELLLTRNQELLNKHLNISETLTHFVPQIDWAKTILRSQRYYEPEAFIQAKAILEQAYHLLSLLYYPTQFSVHYFNMYYRSSSPFEVLMAAQDRQANPFIEFYERTVIPDLVKLSPDLVGFSIADTTQIIPTFTLSFMLKEQFPDIHITIGGTLFSKFAAAVQSHPYPGFDLLFHTVIKGEGEIPLLKLLQALNGENGFQDVPGLIYKTASGEVKLNDPGLPLSMNDIFTPDFDGLPLDRYFVPDVILPVLGSRDCYWKDCVFCDHYVAYSPQYRLRKPQKMAEDLAKLAQKYQARYFSFGDETMSPNYARHLAKGILERNLDISWSMLSRLQKGFDGETCKQLREAGCTYVMLGLESANTEVSDLMEKGTDNETSLTVYRNLDEADICNYSFVFFGFPGETKAQAEETVHFIKQNKSIIHAIGAGVFGLKKYSPLFKQLDKYGVYDLNEMDLEDDWAIDIRYSVKAGMSTEEAQHFYRAFSEDISQAYNVPLWMIDNSRSTIFLYLNHYGKHWLQTTSFRGKAQVILL